MSFGASTGAAFGFDTGTGVAFGGAARPAAVAAAVAAGAAAARRRTPSSIGGVGSTSVAINGMMMTAAKSATCARIESGTVYHFCDPSLIDGSTTSPNMSRGTAQSS